MVVFGIGAMVLVGLGWTMFGYVMGKAPRQNIKIPCLLVCSSVLALAVSGGIGLYQGFPRLSAFGYFITFGVLVICGIANYFQLDLMSRAMQKGPNGIIWSIIQSGFIFPFFMGVVFFGVELTVQRIGGLVSLLGALALFGIGRNTVSENSWKLPAFGAFMMTGLSQMLSNLPSYFPESKDVTSIWRTAAFAVGIALGALMVELPRGKQFIRELGSHFLSLAVWRNSLLLEVPEMVTSYLLLYPGMDILSRAGMGSTAYPVMVGSCIIFFELFSVLVLREKRRLLQWIALVLCLLGVVGICL